MSLNRCIKYFKNPLVSQPDEPAPLLALKCSECGNLIPLPVIDEDLCACGAPFQKSYSKNLNFSGNATAGVHASGYRQGITSKGKCFFEFQRYTAEQADGTGAAVVMQKLDREAKTKIKIVIYVDGRIRKWVNCSLDENHGQVALPWYMLVHNKLPRWIRLLILNGLAIL